MDSMGEDRILRETEDLWEQDEWKGWKDTMESQSVIYKKEQIKNEIFLFPVE